MEKKENETVLRKKCLVFTSKEPSHLYTRKFEKMPNFVADPNN